MKLRDKFLYMTYGAGLVVLGMTLNTLISDANADKGSIDAKFESITCREIIIEDGKGKWRGSFGLDADGDATLQIYGDDRKSTIAYLGKDRKKNGEMTLQLQSKSKTDKREASMYIDGYGGKLNCIDKLGENVAFIGALEVGRGVVNYKIGERRWNSVPPGHIHKLPELPETDSKNPFLAKPKGKYEYK